MSIGRQVPATPFRTASSVVVIKGSAELSLGKKLVALSKVF
jgi:hypothetical protein